MSVQQFAASLNKWVKDLGPYLDQVVQHVAFECAENIIVGGEFAPGSPVDTGFFRANWIVSLDVMPAMDAVVAPVKGTKIDQVALANAEVVLLGAKAGRKLFIVNPVVYGPPLEFGHSKQAPEGMVRITAAAGQPIVDKVAREMLGR